MSEETKATWLAVIVMGALLAFLYSVNFAHARDNGQWENTDPEIRKWYSGLMQPDVPTVSCCGEADAYWADGFETKGDQYIAIITDERPDGPLGRPHIPPGTKILVPNNKLKFDKSNPTGHGIIFLSTAGYVWCYLPPIAS